MEQDKLTYPPELEEHDIPPQQLARLEKSSTPEELAAVIESNIIRRQLKWVIAILIQLFNMVIEDRKAADTVRHLKWLWPFIVGLMAFVSILLQLFKVSK